MPHPATATQVVTLLQRQGALSGEALAQAISVSRAAVHKAVDALRKKGFVIGAAPAKGYVLQSVPDVLCEEVVQPLLATETFGAEHLVHLATASSTNTVAAGL